MPDDRSKQGTLAALKFYLNIDLGDGTKLGFLGDHRARKRHQADRVSPRRQPGWTVDVWVPIKGFVLAAGVRIRFGGAGQPWGDQHTASTR